MGSRVTSRKPPLLPAWVLLRARHSDMRAACRERTAKLMLQLLSWLTASRAGPAPAEMERCRAALQRRACVAWCVQGYSAANERCGRVVLQGGVQDCTSVDMWRAVRQPAKPPSFWQPVLKASAGAASLSLLAEAVTDPSPSLEAVPLPTPTGTVKWLPWRGPMYLGSVSPSTFTWNPSMTGAIWLGTLNSKR